MCFSFIDEKIVAESPVRRKRPNNLYQFFKNAIRMYKKGGVGKKSIFSIRFTAPDVIGKSI